VSDVLQRIRPSPVMTSAGRRMAELQSAMAVAIQSKSSIDGVMLLGPRLSGRIYGAQEQRALQILCNNLAVALENAKLYTQVQDGAIYNDILLDNLVSGIIAVNANRIVTVFNREAQRITRLDAAQVLGQGIERLPYAIAQALGTTFETGTGPRDQDVSLRLGEGQEETPIRLGSALFNSHTGKVLGALLVFNDLSTLKKLEQQVRRTDRLASLGTLSAGMAHEIKNPLVTLKTFTQLLPERYEDPDFRDTFSTLLGQEVRRIDTLVNQLLRFARPTKASLAPMHLHEVVENTLKLVLQQLRQKGVTLNKDLHAETDRIMGDADLLVQALLNFLLNAIDAMENRGELTVTTEIIEKDSPQLNSWGQRASDSYLRLSIRDTGKGIKPDDISHVFDPFFTTKSTGTGLGLSVAHGIILEHHGLIDVESQVGAGTTFYLMFPLARKEAAV
jgi:two-component system sensor histidine kinase HydH